jgi:hypothetical protein
MKSLPPIGERRQTSFLPIKAVCATDKGDTTLTARKELPIKDNMDAGLEAFLHLMQPGLDLPRADVEPQAVKLRLDKGEKKQVSLHVRHQGRGYLSGTVEFSRDIPGLELSSHHFALDSKKSREKTLYLHADTEQLETGKEYRTTLNFSTNGKPEKLKVDVSLLAADRKKRAHEVTGMVLSLGMIPGIFYWILALSFTAWIFGIGSPLDGWRLSPFTWEPVVFLAFVIALWAPLAVLIWGRRPGWYLWLPAGLSLLFIAIGLNRAANAGDTEVVSAFVAFIILAYVPFLIAVCVNRYLYYRNPHLPGIYSLGVTVAAMGLFLLIMLILAYLTLFISGNPLAGHDQQTSSINLSASNEQRNVPQVRKQPGQSQQSPEKYSNVPSVQQSAPKASAQPTSRQQTKTQAKPQPDQNARPSRSSSTENYNYIPREQPRASIPQDQSTPGQQSRTQTKPQSDHDAGQSGPSRIVLTEFDLDRVASAYNSVTRIRELYREEVKGLSGIKKERLKEITHEKMIRAIKAQGLDVETYNRVMQAAEINQELSAQLKKRL